MSSPTQDVPPPVVFRSSKKRKANLRQRANDDEPATVAVASPGTAEDTSSLKDVPPAPQTVDELIASASTSTVPPPAEPSIADALRLRAQRRSRLNGVGFKAPGRDGALPPNSERGLVLHAPHEDPSEPVGGMTTRFAPQTGLSTQLVNKHMMEYIESKLSSRPSPASSETKQPDPQAPPTTTTSTTAPAPALPGSATLQGKLMEIDLGEEARARNVALTERARRRLLGDSAPSSDLDTPDPDPDPARPAKKPRLGRDGKPWRPRNRRNSQDIARDKLVEEILHESRLDVYEPLPEDTPAPGDTTADDRLAEEFRRDFLDAMAQRRQQQAAAAAQKKRNATLAGSSGPARPGAEEDVLRGPKLGGSRSQRAAMRDILLAKEKEKERMQRKR